MTTLETTRSTTATPSFGAVFAAIVGTIRGWNDARVTRKSLGKLTARELDDIGLSRADIESVAVRGMRR